LHSCLSWTCHHLVHVQGHRAPRATTRRTIASYFFLFFFLALPFVIGLGLASFWGRAPAQRAATYPLVIRAARGAKPWHAPSPRAQAQGTKSEVPTPTTSMCTGGGTHHPVLPGVIQLVGSPGTWIYAKMCHSAFSFRVLVLVSNGRSRLLRREWIRTGGSESCCAPTPPHSPLQ
jgi:hypothetical protein